MNLKKLPILLLCLILVQMLCLAHHWHAFFLEMFQIPSTIGQPLTPALACSIAILVGLAVSARLWSGPGMEHFASSALAHVAALALLHYFIGIATGRLLELATPFFLLISIATGTAAWLHRRTHPSKPSPLNPPFSAWDAASVLILAALLIPLFFPYIHYDTKYIWACRAFTLGNTPSFSALAGCAQAYSPKAGPTYPPIWSILLWLGIRDPIFQGRLLAWTLLPLFALFFRARLARMNASLAPPALLFLLATGWVWDDAATYYADVPLMIFLVTGSLLALGLPRCQHEEGPPAIEKIAGTLCLSAGALMRPDGLYTLAVVGAAIVWMRFRRTASFQAWPFLAAFAVALSWTLWRPAALDVASQYFPPNGLWHHAGATTGTALWNLLRVFLYRWQGQWLSHWGVGGAFYLLTGLAIWRRYSAAPPQKDSIFFGTVSMLFILALAFCFAALPFVGDPTVSCLPGTDYLVSYSQFIRTGMGRMTTHLYPFFLLWGVSVIPDIATIAPTRIFLMGKPLLVNSNIFKKGIYFGLCAWALCQPLSIAGSCIAIAITATALLGFHISSRSFPSLRSPLEKPLWIYLLIGILSAAFGIDWRHSLGQLGKDGQMLLDFYIFSAAFALDASLSIQSFLAVGFLIAALIGIGQVTSFFGPAVLKNLLFHCASSAKILEFLAPQLRAHGTIMYLTYGQLLGMGALGFFCYAKTQAPKSNRQISALIFCFILVVGQILSGSRGAWLGTMAGIGLIVALDLSMELAAKAAAAVAAFAAGLFLCPRFLSIGEKAWSLSESSFYLHRQLWKTAWRMFLDHPILGVGLGNFEKLSCRYNPTYFCGQIWDQADNFYLHQLAERGIAGFAATALLSGAMAYQAWRTYKRTRSFLSLWFLSWIVALLFMGLTECSWRRTLIWMPTIALYCWMERGSDSPKDRNALTRTSSSSSAVGPSPEALNALLYLFQRYILRKPFLTATSGFAGLRFHFNTVDAVGRQIYKRGTYEAPISEFLLRTLKPRPGDVIIDAGANLGWYSLLLAAGLRPPVRVFAFEPAPRNFELLRRNIELNACRMVTAVEKALSDSEGTLPLYLYSDKNLGRHSMLPINDGPTVQVGTTSLDRFLAEEKIAPERVAFLKIDVEGYELQVLAGAKTVLGKVPLILCEYSPGYMRRGGHEPRALLELLAGAGYAPYLIPGRDPEPTTAGALAESEIGLNVLWSLAPLHAARQ